MTIEERKALIEERDRRIDDYDFWYEEGDEDECMRALVDIERIEGELEATNDD